MPSSEQKQKAPAGLGAKNLGSPGRPRPRGAGPDPTAFFAAGSLRWRGWRKMLSWETGVLSVGNHSGPIGVRNYKTNSSNSIKNNVSYPNSVIAVERM